MASIYKPKGAKKWKIAYFDFDPLTGKRKRCVVTGTFDKAITEQLAKKLEGEAFLRDRGVIDPEKEASQAREKRRRETLLVTHLESFPDELRIRATTEKYVEATVRQARYVCEACGFRIVADLDDVGRVLDKMNAYVEKLRAADKSAATINAKLTAIKRFITWLVKKEVLGRDPLYRYGSLNAKADPRHARRALSDDELSRLIEAAEAGPPFTYRSKHAGGFKTAELTGPERGMLYALAAGTGLRAAEIGSLTPESFHLTDLDKSTVTVEAGYSKHRRKDVLPLRRDLAEAIAAFIEGRSEGARIFPMPHKPADMLRVDLEAAGIPYRDGSGRVSDFHALRHTFVSRLARSGIAPAVAMKLARHSSITLTMNSYTHVLVTEEREALERLPTIGNGSSETQTARATGTFDGHPFAEGERSGARAACPESPPVSAYVTTASEAANRETPANKGECRSMSPCVAASHKQPEGMVDSWSISRTDR